MNKPYYHDEKYGITIYHGDCRDILPNLEPVDLVLTDPPYGMNRFATDCKDCFEILAPAFRLFPVVMKDTASAFIFTSTAEVLRLGSIVPLTFRRLLWMYKPADCTFPLQGWLLTSEAILWFCKNGVPLLAERKPFRHDCYIHKRVGLEGVEGHPTVKPLAIVKDLASRCIDGGMILDPFMGSGTTLVAAKELGRKAIGIEIEEKYCEIAVRRLQQDVFQFKEVKS